MNAVAWFRFTWTVKSTDIRLSGSSVSLPLRDAPVTHGSFLAPEADGEPWHVAAECNVPVDQKQFAALQDIARRRLPKGADLTKDPAGNAERWLSGEVHVLSLPVLPPRLQTLITDTRGDLSTQARRLLDLGRWVCNAESPHSPLSRGVLEFSLDLAEWVLAPAPPPGKPVNLRVDSGIDTGAVDWAVVSAKALEGQYEPVGHSLIREALSLRQSAPRSAVVLGAAAAETAVKESIHRLAPEATYLIDNMPSPPIVKLVQRYLPTLKSSSARAAQVFPPPASVLRSLTWIVETRNKVVHNRQQTLWFPELLDCLLAVRDLVWLLDYISGNDWALAHVSSDLRRELSLDSGDGG